MQFLVSHVSIDRNIRGHEMRRIHLVPIAGEAFGGTDVAPDAHIDFLLTPDAAERFAIGNTFDVSFREREQ